MQVLSRAPHKKVNEKHRFALLYLGLMGMLCGAFGSYTFNLVSGAFQTKYGLNQRDLTTITTTGTVIGYVMLPYSFVYDYFGPLPIAVLSAFVFPLGALLTALSFQGVIVGTTVKLCVFYSFMNVGTSYYDLSSCVTILGYFPGDRGAVIALLKTFIGLGSAIIGSLYQGFFKGEPGPFFYFLMAIAFTVGVLSSIFMRHPAYELTGYEESHLPEEEKARRVDEKGPYLKQRPPMWRFYYGFGVIIFLIAFLPTASALVNYLDLNEKYRFGFAFVSTVSLASFAVIAIPFPKRGNAEREGAAAVTASEPLNESEHAAYAEEAAPGKSKEAVVAEVFLSPEDTGRLSQQVPDTEIDYIAPQYQTSFLRNLLTVELWALWWTIFCISGTMDVITNNASYIFASLAGRETSDDTRNLLTVLNGVGSGTGRLFMALLEYQTQRRAPEKRIPLTVALFIPTTLVIITLVLLLSLPRDALPLPYVVAAFGNGFLAASMILVTQTIYAKDHAKHYHFCFFATAMASIALNRYMYGEWYTVHNTGQEDYCTHRVCVQTPLLVLLGLCVSAFGSNMIVHVTYRRFCNKILEERERILQQHRHQEISDEAPREADHYNLQPVAAFEDAVDVAPPSFQKERNVDSDYRV
ncbi:hypothetical protein STCU_00928 [Strigomonas culicis]|uniref:Nodulin-like domain-containing protein n=1 Tax=Strigomonas culicis TaxID=28005 RepID=S9WIM6_9TRYP|nr:hypothetical protein STCU_06476 [Strigomonas culicis]EPY35755.1 hypothetical protein STCU_00928 [Strigomonas culicis]|eukprot:EPY25789.1 hypothetical protein STCU_06476 [Strigomonas culicis]